MIDTLNRLQTRKLNDSDYKLLYPMMKWTSGSILNIPACSFINRRFFYVDNEILIKILSIYIKDRGYIQYPKPKKFDKEKFDLVVQLLKKKYFLSNSDIESARKVIEKLIKDKQYLSNLANDFGLDNTTRIKLGVNKIKLDNTKAEVQKTKNLMDW